MNFVISLPGIFQNYRLLLLTAYGLISLEKFFTGLSSRLSVLLGGKQLMARLELAITVLQTVPLTSWVHEHVRFI